jgi:hypothetical protein
VIIGSTVVSAFTASRVYLSEQFPTALRGRGHLLGKSCGKILADGQTGAKIGGDLWRAA